MSWLALDWAETTPVADVYERVILTLMAARAKKDGTGVYLSPATMARRAVCDEKTVERRLRALRERGVIAFGDQSLAARIPIHRRPKVYDLLIPYSTYTPGQIAEINQERAELGALPLRPDDRPNLPDVVTPSRNVRSDRGKPRKKQADEQPVTWDDAGQGLLDPPVDNSRGGTTSPGEGGLVVPDGGTTRPTNLLEEDRPSETVQPPTPRGAGGEADPPVADAEPDVDPDVVAAIYVERRQRRNARRPAALNAGAWIPAARPFVDAFSEGCAVPPTNGVRAKWMTAVTDLIKADYPAPVIETALAECRDRGYGPKLLADIACGVANRKPAQPKLNAADARFLEQVHNHHAWFDENGELRPDALPLPDHTYPEQPTLALPSATSPHGAPQ